MSFRAIICVFSLLIAMASPALAREVFVPVPSPDDKLKATEWRVVEVDGSLLKSQSVSQPLYETRPLIKFGDDNQLYVDYSNDGWGQYSANATSLTVSGLSSEMSYNPGTSATEGSLFGILRHSQRYEIDKDTLTIYSKDGKTLKATRL